MPAMARTSWISLATDSWLLGMEASAVVALRLAKISACDAAAIEESRRMVSEKIEAALMLQLRAMTGGLGTSGAAAAARTIGHYGKAVRANRRRLGPPRPRRKKARRGPS